MLSVLPEQGFFGHPPPLNLHVDISALKDHILPTFFFRKNGYIKFVPKLVGLSVGMCVHTYVRTYVYTSVLFLVNASPTKQLGVATANYAGA